ncbi:MAG: hypothetical protein IPM17_17430 [Verrucomicrobia bacterium]|nr:hypothetical protein [Verrucomicrobiota bacterium]
MQYQIYTVALSAGASGTDELNRFLRGHRVLAVERRLVEAGQTQDRISPVLVGESDAPRTLRAGSPIEGAALHHLDFNPTGNGAGPRPRAGGFWRCAGPGPASTLPLLSVGA